MTLTLTHLVQVPYLSRVALVVLVPLNALSQIKHDSSLQFSTLTIVLGFCIFVNLASSCLWGLYWHRKKSQCVQNAVLPPLHGGGVVERTEEVNQQPTKGSINSSTSSSSPLTSKAGSVLAGDFSSDEEEHSPVTPPSISILRRRMFGKESTFDIYQKIDSSQDSDLTNMTAEKSEGPDTTTLSNVRRHLLDHLSTYQPRPFHHNIALDARDTPTSSPMKESALNRSTEASHHQLSPSARKPLITKPLLHPCSIYASRALSPASSQQNPQPASALEVTNIHRQNRLGVKSSRVDGFS
ncbi:hypothetical protein GWK47_049403 [Chionoecetes opilio]|uniref:Uncharacterized protein n=1 Tax=Chionoecetes opilio TaxID=41210 RepID=A0A8J4YB15_CHIOP|nr:hypothetical protein GWK47_049403 [Chionoecetes opilio]